MKTFKDKSNIFVQARAYVLIHCSKHETRILITLTRVSLKGRITQLKSSTGPKPQPTFQATFSPNDVAWLVANLSFVLVPIPYVIHDSIYINLKYLMFVCALFWESYPTSWKFSSKLWFWNYWWSCVIVRVLIHLTVLCYRWR